MVEAQDTKIDSSNQEKTVLAKIEPVKVEANPPDIESSHNDDVPFDGRIELEKSLIAATILEVSLFSTPS